MSLTQNIYHDSSIAVGSRKAQHVYTEGQGLLVGSRLRQDLFVHHIARVDTSLAWDPALEPFDVDYEDAHTAALDGVWRVPGA